METPPRRPERTLLVRLPSSSKEETPPPLSGRIRLDAPRPPPSRTQNVYVDAPLPSSNSTTTTPPHHPSSKSEFKQQSVICTQPVIKRTIPPPPASSSIANPSKLLSDSILKSSSFNNNNNNVTSGAGTSGSPNDEEEESIICRECGKCKCQACATPKKLPRKWICSGKMLCSPESAVETLSCYCCVKGAFYHCQKDSEIEWESPVSCSSRDGHCCLRWTALGALSLLMPCLWCYLPLTGCLRLANYVYGRASVSGCKCPGMDPSLRQPGLILRDPQ